VSTCVGTDATCPNAICRPGPRFGDLGRRLNRPAWIAVVCGMTAVWFALFAVLAVIAGVVGFRESLVLEAALAGMLLGVLGLSAAARGVR
jgi:hypothetical protein